MIQAANRRQFLELMLTIVMGLALLLNINTLMSTVDFKAPDMQIGAQLREGVNSFAQAGDQLQALTEKGIIPTLTSGATEMLVGSDNMVDEAPPAPAVETQPVAPQEDNGIGSWINQSGNWAIGLLTPSADSAPGQFAVAVGNDLRELFAPMSEAFSEFSHLSRPTVVSNVLSEGAKTLQSSVMTMSCMAW